MERASERERERERERRKWKIEMGRRERNEYDERKKERKKKREKGEIYKYRCLEKNRRRVNVWNLMALGQKWWKNKEGGIKNNREKRPPTPQKNEDA